MAESVLNCLPARLFFFISVLRNAFVIIVLTLAAYLYCHPRRTKAGKYPIKILLTVPAGLKHVKQPNVDKSLLAALAPELPVATIILLLEHIAISKCELPGMITWAYVLISWQRSVV